ncbi:MAG: hypothetical protein J0H67_23580, partial [Rhodospirillales bacterium]|nr:hypothetical protein [Rhodospirillales bacterium]
SPPAPPPNGSPAFAAPAPAALPAAASPAAPGGAAGKPVNGTFNGLMTLASGSDGSCGSQDLITLQVRNGAFDYVLNQPQVPYQPQRAFHVTIAPDGSFRTDLGGAFMSGSVRGGHMSGQIVGDVCSYAFDADSTGTW